MLCGGFPATKKEVELVEAAIGPISCALQLDGMLQAEQLGLSSVGQHVPPGPTAAEEAASIVLKMAAALPRTQSTPHF